MKDLPPAFRSIPSGGELVEALDDAFAKHRGWVQATGFVEDVELKLGSGAADARRVFRGRFALSQLMGPLGGPYGVTLARSAGEGVEVIAGVLVRARSGGVSALCISAGDSLSRPQTEGTGDAATPSPVESSFAKRPLAPTSTFAARVGVSQAEDDEDDEDVLPERGDLVEHFAFGVCEVLSVTGDRLVLRDWPRGGRIREIALERLSVTGPIEHQGKRMFRLSRR